MCSGRVGPVPLGGPEEQLPTGARAARGLEEWPEVGHLRLWGRDWCPQELRGLHRALRGCRGQGWDQRAEQSPEHPCARWRWQPPPCSRPTHIFHYLCYYRTVTVSISPRWGLFTDSLSTRASSVACLAGSHVFQIP